MVTEPIRDLQWLYQEMASDIGTRSTWVDPTTLTYGCRIIDGVAEQLMPGWVSHPPPTRKQLQAAARARRIVHTLKPLSSVHKAILEQCYSLTVRAMASSDLRQFGVAAGALAFAERRTREQRQELVARKDKTKRGTEERKQATAALKAYDTTRQREVLQLVSEAHEAYLRQLRERRASRTVRRTATPTRAKLAPWVRPETAAKKIADWLIEQGLVGAS